MSEQERKAIAFSRVALACFVVGLVGCKQDSNMREGAGAAVSATAASDSFGPQLALGHELYRAKCASCHGERGEGNLTVAPPAPAIAGQGALPVDPRQGASRKKQFLTAANLQRYIGMRMPPTEAGRLSDEQTWALSAYVLALNGIDSGGRVLEAAVASSIPLHRAAP